MNKCVRRHLMEKRILEIMTELVAMKSTSCSVGEQEPAKWFENFFKSMPYFQAHSELTGVYEIPKDPYLTLYLQKSTARQNLGHTK